MGANMVSRPSLWGGFVEMALLAGEAGKDYFTPAR